MSKDNFESKYSPNVPENRISQLNYRCKFFRMNCLCGLSTVNDFLNLRRWVMLKAHFPLKSPVIYLGFIRISLQKK